MGCKYNDFNGKKEVGTGGAGRHWCEAHMLSRWHGAMAARLTPDQKVGSSNVSALILLAFHQCSGALSAVHQVEWRLSCD